MKKISELNQLLENKSFIEFALNTNEKSSQYWNEYLRTYPDQISDIQKLKQLAIFLHSAKKKQPLFKTRYELRNLNDAIDFRESHSKTLRRTSSIRSISYMWMKIAAVFIIVFSLGGLSLYMNWLPLTVVSTKTSKAMAKNQIIVPLGEKCQVILSEGSKVWLNAGSKFTYPQNFVGGNRTVKLEGEGYFDVIVNKQRPFIIETDKITVEVLGTSFNLKAYPDEDIVETTLIEGSVKIFRPQDKQTSPFYLNPNEKATYDIAENKMKILKLPKPTNTIEVGKTANNTEAEIPKKSPIQPNIIESIISWKDQELVFNSESLSEIAKKLERWYGYEVILQESHSLGDTYTGKFIHNESIEQVLDVLKRTTPIKYEIMNNKVVISKDK